ncbi:hypothetical protein Tco_1486208, partial [Tanacetum coccineum]
MSSQTPLLQSEIIKAPGLNMYHRTNSIVELADHNIWSAINEFCHAPSLRRVKLRHNVHEDIGLRLAHDFQKLYDPMRCDQVCNVVPDLYRSHSHVLGVEAERLAVPATIQYC